VVLVWVVVLVLVRLLYHRIMEFAQLLTVAKVKIQHLLVLTKR